MKKLALATVFILSTTLGAMAHSPLKSTSPANNASLAAFPEKLDLVFAKPARITKVVLKYSKDGASSEDKLVLPSKKFEREFRLKPVFAGTGDYTVEWRALSEDGHAIKGKFKFTVTGE